MPFGIAFSDSPLISGVRNELARRLGQPPKISPRRFAALQTSYIQSSKLVHRHAIGTLASPNSPIEMDENGDYYSTFSFRELLPHHIRFVQKCFPGFDHFYETRANTGLLEWIPPGSPGLFGGSMCPDKTWPCRATATRLLFMCVCADKVLRAILYPHMWAYICHYVRYTVLVIKGDSRDAVLLYTLGI